MTSINLQSPAGIRILFMEPQNVLFLQEKITSILLQSFKQKIIVPLGSIKNVMLKILDERFERLDRMNQRVVMEITNQYRVHYLDTLKKLKWQENFTKAVSLFDADSNKGHQIKPKLRDHLKDQKVGGTLQFYFS